MGGDSVAPVITSQKTRLQFAPASKLLLCSEDLPRSEAGTMPNLPVQGFLKSNYFRLKGKEKNRECLGGNLAVM